MALLGLLMREILVEHMSCSDSFRGAGKMIYSLYHQGQERQDFPLFSLSLFCAFTWCKRSLLVFQHKREMPQGQQSQGTPFLPIQTPWEGEGAVLSLNGHRLSEWTSWSCIFSQAPMWCFWLFLFHPLPLPWCSPPTRELMAGKEWRAQHEEQAWSRPHRTNYALKG